MSKNNLPLNEDELENNDASNQPEQSDETKPREDQNPNRRKALKTIIGASSLLIVNPFMMRADASGQMMMVTPSASVTPTPSSSVGALPTPTPSPSSTSVTPTPSSSSIPTPTPSVTQGLTPTPSPSNGLTQTPSASSFGVSSTPTPTPSSSNSTTQTPTPTPSSSNGATQTPTPTPSPSSSNGVTQTPTPTNSITPSATNSATPTATSSSTPTPTPSSSSSVLPVELSQFSAREGNGSIRISWRTETEINNDGFELQRSTNGFTFNKISWIKGRGNSVQSTNYNYEDKNVNANQLYYYRLKQKDFDGTTDYSNIISLKLEGQDEIKVKDIYPNVVRNGFVNIEIVANSTNQAELLVMSMSGQLITRKKTSIRSGQNMIRIDLQNAAAGIYVVNVNFAKGKNQTKKFVVRQ